MLRLANAEFYLDSFQCKHLVLGCVHDGGYASWLQRFVGDAQMADRMTLIEGHSFLPSIRRLNLSSTRFDNVFQGPPTVRESPSYAATAATRPSEDPKFPKADLSGVVHLEVQSHRLSPVVRDASGKRIDRPLKVNKAVADRIARSELCYWLYLRGRCEIANDSGHKRNHCHRSLTDTEYDALWFHARAGRCRRSVEAEQGKGLGCIDPLCVHRHHK